MVLVQAGHLNIEGNCDVSLRTGTGAPGEKTWTSPIAHNVVAALSLIGVDAREIDANFNCDPARSQDYDAVVSIHYQANLPTPSGFFVGRGDPAQDGAADKSQRLTACIEAHYSLMTGLVWRPEWNNVNITHYYLFESLSKPTPFALIECGVGAPGAPDHDFLWSVDGQGRVVKGIADGIAAFLGKLPARDLAQEVTTLEQEVGAIQAKLDKVGHTLEGG